MTRERQHEIRALGAKHHERNLVAPLIARCQQPQRRALRHFQAALRRHRSAGVHQKQHVAETGAAPIMLHEIGGGEADALLAGANPALRRSRQGLLYGQGSRVLKGHCADHALRTRGFRCAPADSLTVDRIRDQTYGTAIRPRRCELQPRTLGACVAALAGAASPSAGA